MLIICSGPETFLAKNKSKELVEAYRTKHVAQGAVIENLDHLEDPAKDALSRLANIGLFATKRLLKYDGLIASCSQTQLKQLSRLISTDDDLTVVLSYENKRPTQKVLDLFPDKKAFVYAFDELKGKELDKWFSERCRFYSVRNKPNALLETFGNDLWSIETSLQILCVSETLELNGQNTTELSVFDVIDRYFATNKWKSQTKGIDAQELLPLLVSQVLNWHKVHSGRYENIHPYVAKKLSSVKFDDHIQKTLSVLRSLYASRSSVSQPSEIVQTI